jgi:hypothetical protein
MKYFFNFFSLIFSIVPLFFYIYPIFCWGETTFTDATIEAGVSYTAPMTWGCSFTDINNDGYIDIFIPNHYIGEPRLYLNNGDGTFSEAASLYGLEREDFYLATSSGSYGDFHGGVWGDFDNDGDVDLYVVCGAGGGTTVKSNHLMRNDGSIFTEVSNGAGVADEYGRGRTPIWVDYDNDGNLDLFVTNDARSNAPNVLFHNNGDGTFTNTTYSAGVGRTDGFEGAVWGDYDGDGYMDLFMSIPGYDKGSPILYKNNGNGTFSDITAEAGLDRNSTEYLWNKGWRWGGGIALGDYDNDGRLDLFIAQGVDQQGLEWDEESIKFYNNVDATNEKYVNFKTTGNQVTFNLMFYGYDLTTDSVFIGQNSSHPASIPFTLNDGEAYGRPENPSDVTFLIWQDEDDKEWHISMKKSVTGVNNTNRSGSITSNGSFYGVAYNFGVDIQANTFRSFLFHNNGDGTFTDVSYDAGLTYQGWSASASWADFDNDGYLDLYVVNYGAFESAPNSFYHNNGNGTFTEMAASAGVTGAVAGRGDVAVVGDYNNDGFQDIFITNSRTLGLFANGPYILYKNNGNNNNWLEIKTIGTISNWDGIGAKVWLTTGGVTQYREQNGGTTLYGQNSTILHFGLGSASTVDHLEVNWPSGKSQILSNLAVNQILTVVEEVIWNDVIFAYNEYVSGNKPWGYVITTYQLYVMGQ